MVAEEQEEGALRGEGLVGAKAWRVKQVCGNGGIFHPAVDWEVGSPRQYWRSSWGQIVKGPQVVV